MGCDVHCVLQKKNEHGRYVTVLTDVFPARNYEFFSFLSGVRGYGPGIAHERFPDDFCVLEDTLDHTPDGTLEGYWMGDHSYGWISVKEFCEARAPKSESCIDISAAQFGLKMFLDPYNEDTYRLVFGYDS